jgi:hypothetical protein
MIVLDRAAHEYCDPLARGEEPAVSLCDSDCDTRNKSTRLGIKHIVSYGSINESSFPVIWKGLK